MLLSPQLLSTQKFSGGFKLSEIELTDCLPKKTLQEESEL